MPFITVIRACFYVKRFYTCIIIAIGYLERELLPLQQPSVNEWGTGLVLVTTNNAGVIPQDKVAGSESTITVDPLSVEESAKLIGTLTEYELSENETQKLTTTTDIKNWRYIPPVMARYVDFFEHIYTVVH